MALLNYTHEKQKYDFTIPQEKGLCTSLNRDNSHGWQFTSDEDIQESLAQIIRAENGFYALIVQRGKDVKVNDVPVFVLHILRDADRIQAEQEELQFYEWIRQKVVPDSQLLGSSCLFCSIPFQVEDQVIYCPKCDTPMHDYCWVSREDVGEGCIVPNCGYMPPEKKPYIPLAQEQ